MGKEKDSKRVQFNHAWDISITPTDTGDSGVKRNGLTCMLLMVLQGKQMLVVSIRRAENVLGSKRSISRDLNNSVLLSSPNCIAKGKLRALLP